MSQSIINQTVLSLLGGALAFVSLCTVLVLLAYVSFVLGVAALAHRAHRVKLILLTAMSFAIGFSIVFAYGLIPSAAQLFLVDAFHPIAKVAGAAAIAFGLLFIHQYSSAGQSIMTTRSWSAAGFVYGALLAAVWPYCVGPVLGALVSLAAAPWSAARGQYLLIVYVLGLAVAFGVSTVALSRIFSALLARVEPATERGLLLAAGVIQITVGVSLVFTDWWLSLNRVFIGLSGNSPQARLEEVLFRLLG